MSPECMFQLNKPYEIYGCGEYVEGSIALKLINPESIEAIHITLRGHGWVSWQEYDEINKETTEFRADKVYAQVKQDLMGEGSLAPGVYTFPFSLQIPEDCPASFESSVGTIRYHLAVVVVTKARSKLNFKYDINVEQQDDLNLHPEYKIPIQVEETKKFCCVLCTEGRILFTLTSTLGAYAPMQQLHYILRVENHSMSDVKGYEVAVCQTTTYTARSPYYKNRFENVNVVEEQYDDTCLKLSTRIFEYDIEIPAVPPSTDGDADDIIHIAYDLKVTAFIPGCTMDAEIILPLHIGTIALGESLQEGRGTDVVAISPSAPIYSSIASGGADKPPHYQKPPSFSEATKSGEQLPSSGSAITSSAPPYEGIYNERNRPYVGFKVPT